MTNAFEEPGSYRIVIQGQFHASDCDLIGGMRIAKTENFEVLGLVTTLVGRLMDQAQLVGILNTLYGIHLAILEVEALTNWEESH